MIKLTEEECVVKAAEMEKRLLKDLVMNGDYKAFFKELDELLDSTEEFVLAYMTLRDENKALKMERYLQTV